MKKKINTIKIICSVKEIDLLKFLLAANIFANKDSESKWFGLMLRIL